MTKLCSASAAWRPDRPGVIERLNGLVGDHAVDLDEPEAERADIGLVDRVAVHEHRLAEEHRLQQRVAEALVQARVGDQVGREVRLGQGVGGADGPALVVGSEPVRGVPQVDLGPLRAAFQRDEVVEALVAGGTGDEDHRRRGRRAGRRGRSSARCPCAGHPRGLDDEEPRIAHPELGPHLPPDVVPRGAGRG